MIPFQVNAKLNATEEERNSLKHTLSMEMESRMELEGQFKQCISKGVLWGRGCLLVELSALAPRPSVLCSLQIVLGVSTYYPNSGGSCDSE